MEIELEAIRLVKEGQSLGATAKILGFAQQTLQNWVKEERAGKLTGAGARPVSAEQMELARRPDEESSIINRRYGMRFSGARS